MQFLSFANIKTNWKQFLINESQLPYFIDLDLKLFKIASTEIIFPPKQLIFQAFNFFDVEKTKVVIFGQDPYFNDEQANGLAFSVNKHLKTPPSLRNIFNELYSDINIKRDNNDLSDWAEQGVLLLNTILTVTKQKPNSHAKLGWMNFTHHVIDFLNQQEHKIVFVLLGNNAKSLKKLINSKHHIIIETSHPSPLSYKRGFNGSKLFSQINTYLIDKINW